MINLHRAEEVLRLVKYKELSSAERAEAAELEELNEKLHTLEIRLNQLKKKDVERSVRFEMNIKSENKPETVLSMKQHEIIENNLKQTYVIFFFFSFFNEKLPTFLFLFINQLCSYFTQVQRHRRDGCTGKNNGEGVKSLS